MSYFLQLKGVFWCVFFSPIESFHIYVKLALAVQLTGPQPTVRTLSGICYHICHCLFVG